MTAEDIAKLRGLLERATPGPWTTERYDGPVDFDVYADDGRAIVCRAFGPDENKDRRAEYNAALIAAAVNALPQILDEHERAMAVVRAVAARDTFEPDAGWPMGQCCGLCDGFGAYPDDGKMPEQPSTGDEEADWSAYRAAMDVRRKVAVAAIEHAPDCAWVAARGMVVDVPAATVQDVPDESTK